jgi:UDP:flavonoid glycosyltransferase YjiC (YdhE family)
MVSVMVTVMPFAGHVGPLRPVVAELVARGHRVRVHTGRRYHEAFRAAGATVVPWQAAADFDENDLSATFPAVLGGKGPRQTLINLRQVFVGTAGGQARDLAAAWAAEPWDVLLGDTTCFGTGLAGELTGAPWASVSIVPLTMPSRDLPPAGLGLAPGHNGLGRARDAVLRAVADAVLDAALRGPYTSARREVGLPGGGRRVATAAFSPFLVLATSVPELEHPRSDLPPHVHLVGRMDAPPPAASALPPWWDEVARADRPVVHVTQGTFNADPAELLLPTLDALADEPVLVVATTGRGGRRALPGAVPANARVTDLLPYGELLPRTTVMVTNGGWGGVTAALAHGVPLVVAGGDIDKPEIAARVAWSGAGIDLRTGTPSSHAVGEAVRSVLTSPSYAAAAARIAAGFAAHDGPREAADLLEQLAVQRTPVHRPVAQLWA